MHAPRIHRYHDGHDHAHGHAHNHDHDHAREFADFSNDPAQQSLVNALRAGFNVLRVVMIALVVAYVATGIMTVHPGEQGLIVRFGQLVPNNEGAYVYGPGWGFSLPEPFVEKILIPGKTQTRQIASFVFKRKREDFGRPLAEVAPENMTLRPEEDGAMLTGDQNLTHGLWQIEYRIDNAEAFVRNVRGAELLTVAKPGAADASAPAYAGAAFDQLIVRLLEQSIVRETATRRVEDIVGAGKTSLQAAVKGRLQNLLNKYETGVIVDKVVAETVYPWPVRDAFNLVTNAENEAKRLKETALQQATQVLTKAAGANHAELTAAIDAYGAAQASNAPPAKVAELRRRIDDLLETAGGDAATRLAEASAQANGIRETAKTELKNFQSQREEFRNDPARATMRIWNDVRYDILGSKANELFYLPSLGNLEIVTNRDLQKLIEREINKYKNPQGGNPPR